MMNEELLMKVLRYKQKGSPVKKIAWLLGIKITAIYHLSRQYKKWSVKEKWKLLT